MDEEQTDLEVLFPDRSVKCKGEDISVLPLYFGQFPKAIKLIRPIADVLSETKIFTLTGKPPDVKFTISDNWLSAIPELLEKGGESLIQFVAYCVAKPRPWFDTLDFDEGLRLTKAVFEENSNFFVRKVMPMLAELGLATVSTVKVSDTPLQSSEASATA